MEHLKSQVFKVWIANMFGVGNKKSEEIDDICRKKGWKNLEHKNYFDGCITMYCAHPNNHIKKLTLTLLWVDPFPPLPRQPIYHWRIA